METMSRRSMLRVFGSAAGAGVVGAAAISSSGLLAPSVAAGGSPVRAHRKAARKTSMRVITAAGTPLIGMNAPANVWAQRCKEVGPGLGARRIFADLAQGPNSQIKLVEQAHAARQLPVISYKVGGDAAGAADGRFNAVAEKAAAKLASYGLPTAVTFWHEPHKNLTPAQYVAASKQILPIFKRGRIRVGPFLNGWLLDNQVSTFATYCPDELFELWDWMGIDTYETGTMESPGKYKPADRIYALSDYVKARGFDLPIGVGEYNGYSAQSIADAGNALLSTPKVWFGCVWNTTGGVGYQLTGDRLEAFKGTLADPRSADVN
jgi:hypothetical protein